MRLYAGKPGSAISKNHGPIFLSALFSERPTTIFLLLGQPTLCFLPTTALKYSDYCGLSAVTGFLICQISEQHCYLWAI